MNKFKRFYCCNSLKVALLTILFVMINTSFSLASADEFYVNWSKKTKIKKIKKGWFISVSGKAPEGTELILYKKVKLRKGSRKKVSYKYKRSRDLLKNKTYPVKSRKNGKFHLNFYLKENGIYYFKAIVKENIKNGERQIFSLKMLISKKKALVRTKLLRKISGKAKPKKVVTEKKSKLLKKDNKKNIKHKIQFSVGSNFHSHSLDVPSINSEVSFTSIGFTSLFLDWSIAPSPTWSILFEANMFSSDAPEIELATISGDKSYSAILGGFDFVINPSSWEIKIMGYKTIFQIYIGGKYYILPFAYPDLKEVIQLTSNGTIFGDIGFGGMIKNSSWELDGYAKYLLQLGGGDGNATNSSFGLNGMLRLNYRIGHSFVFGLIGDMLFITNELTFESQLSGTPIAGTKNLLSMGLRLNFGYDF